MIRLFPSPPPGPLCPSSGKEHPAVGICSWSTMMSTSKYISFLPVILPAILSTHSWEWHLALQETNGRTMITPWTKDVDRDAPQPEYPRPQMQRPAWQNLNGQWEFDCTSLTGALPNLNETLKRKITVPFPVESYLSGACCGCSSCQWFCFNQPGLASNVSGVPKHWHAYNM